MSVCVLQNLEKYRVLWTDFLASCREINRFSVSKIGPEPAKPTISLALFGGVSIYFNSEMKMTKFANSVDLDEVAHNEPPHLDLHCLASSL